ncbi:MAG: hypothetical protein HOC71_10450, partial [Candidatus Latescibacteria bacterium]|nr:hypothetical protein [Candidatus Latescibacterota bacterium]
MKIPGFIAMAMLLILPGGAVFAEESCSKLADPETKLSKLESELVNTINEY